MLSRPCMQAEEKSSACFVESQAPIFQVSARRAGVLRPTVSSAGRWVRFLYACLMGVVIGLAYNLLGRCGTILQSRVGDRHRSHVGLVACPAEPREQGIGAAHGCCSGHRAGHGVGDSASRHFRHRRSALLQHSSGSGACLQLEPSPVRPAAAITASPAGLGAPRALPAAFAFAYHRISYR